jgi:hypothetical protein
MPGAESVSGERIVLVVQSWSSECGSCGFGRGGWAASPALKDPPKEPLTPQSRVCNGCGKRFTHIENVYAWEGPVPIPADEEAA